MKNWGVYCIEYNVLLKLISPISLLSVATRSFKIMYVAHFFFLVGWTILSHL